MDTKTILLATAVAGGLYILLTILEKLLIRKKAKELTEVKTNDSRTSNGTDTTDNVTE